MTAPVTSESALESMTALADSGDLRLADDVSSACVNACAVLIDELDALRRRTRGTSTPAA